MKICQDCVAVSLFWSVPPLCAASYSPTIYNPQLLCTRQDGNGKQMKSEMYLSFCCCYSKKTHEDRLQKGKLESNLSVGNLRRKVERFLCPPSEGFLQMNIFEFPDSSQLSTPCISVCHLSALLPLMFLYIWICERLYPSSIITLGAQDVLSALSISDLHTLYFSDLFIYIFFDRLFPS